MAIPAVVADTDILASWGEDVTDRLNELTETANFMPFAYPMGMSPGVASTGQSALIAVSGGNAGAIACPFELSGPMLIQSVSVRQGSTASARSCEFGLYRDVGNAAWARITGTTGTMSFTPSAADDRTANVATPGTLLLPGVVWLVIRNTHATQTFVVRRSPSVTELVLSTGWQDNTGGIASLGATLDPTSWDTKLDSFVIARLNGRVNAQSAAF